MNHQITGQTLDEHIDRPEIDEPLLCNYCDQKFDGEQLEMTFYNGKPCGFACPECLTEVKKSEKMETKIKELCTTFFRWWWNQPGNNTDQGFDEWAKKDGKKFIASIIKIEKQRDELLKQIGELSEQLQNGRHYLMGIEPKNLTVEDALEVFGFGRNGLGNN